MAGDTGISRRRPAEFTTVANAKLHTNYKHGQRVWVDETDGYYAVRPSSAAGDDDATIVITVNGSSADYRLIKLNGGGGGGGSVPEWYDFVADGGASFENDFTGKLEWTSYVEGGGKTIVEIVGEVYHNVPSTPSDNQIMSGLPSAYTDLFVGASSTQIKEAVGAFNIGNLSAGFTFPLLVNSAAADAEIVALDHGQVFRRDFGLLDAFVLTIKYIIQT